MEAVESRAFHELAERLLKIPEKQVIPGTGAEAWPPVPGALRQERHKYLKVSYY